MSSPASITLRDELVAVLGIVEPQMRGWKSLNNDPALSEETLAFIANHLDVLAAFRDACQAAIDAIDALPASYPNVPVAEVSPEMNAELQAHEEDIDAAVDSVTTTPVATGGVITVPGSAVPKP